MNRHSSQPSSTLPSPTKDIKKTSISALTTYKNNNPPRNQYMSRNKTAQLLSEMNADDIVANQKLKFNFAD
jgi:hypothetical protein